MNQELLKNPDNLDIKSVITGHPKASHKLSKAIKQAKKLGSNTPFIQLYKKSENFLNKKKKN